MNIAPLAAVFLASALMISDAAGQDRDAIAGLSPDVLTAEQRAEARGTIDRDIAARTAAFNERHRQLWAEVKSADQWRAYRDERIGKLRESLGDLPATAKPNVRTTGVIAGDGFRIENIVYESRPGLWVTANLYTPAQPRKTMPGLLVVPSHHNAKTQSELQDMGMLWARAGCLVLVGDPIGYGERRTHPFHTDADYAKPYRASRQDYYFRYDAGVQLHLLGDSLMGWMVGDLMRGVDVLLAREGIDPNRIILLGSVAGGGDPAGVTAALDPRIAACVPFNFGGPQPETRYPLPDDAESSFNFLAGAYWDSTRGLRLTARDDFPHWVITASIAPRRLIHAHEFAWDRDRDPVWKRYQKVWGELTAGVGGNVDQLGVAHGKGVLKLRPPEASHCNNIGAFHRQMIHPLFEKWFDIKAQEYSAPRKSDELRCLTDMAKRELSPKTALQVMGEEANLRLIAARVGLSKLSQDQRREAMRQQWSRLLGPVKSKHVPVGQWVGEVDENTYHNVHVLRMTLDVEPGVVIPFLLLSPNEPQGRKPLVIAIAHAGKAGFFKSRAAELNQLLKAGVCVALPDLRGTGETAAGASRGRDSGDTDRSVRLQLFGETAIGQRLRDVRALVTWAKDWPHLDPKRIAIWGDSFAPTNPADTDFKIPHAVTGWPDMSEPSGPLLALLTGLFEEVRAVHISGGLAEYRTVLDHFAVLVPHDAVVPGAIAAGDIPELAASLAPTPLRIASAVDHLNRPVVDQTLTETYRSAVQQYRDAGTLEIGRDDRSAAEWLISRLRQP